MWNLSLLLWVLLFVDGVLGANEEKSVSVSVMKGDSVTLHTGVSELQPDDKIYWTRGEDIIISNTENRGISDKSVLERSFEGRLMLDLKTGSLTISNITSEHTGIYEVDISGSGQILKNFSVTVHDEVKTVSVNEGDSLILRTGVLEIKGYNQIVWKFEDHNIAEINKKTNRFSLFHANGRFEGRLQPDHQTGSLTISKSRTTDSGDYHLYMNSNGHAIQRMINVTVCQLEHIPDPGPHTGFIIALICCSLLVVALVGFVIYHCCKINNINAQRGHSGDEAMRIEETTSLNRN